MEPASWLSPERMAASANPIGRGTPAKCLVSRLRHGGPGPDPGGRARGPRRRARRAAGTVAACALAGGRCAYGTRPLPQRRPTALQASPPCRPRSRANAARRRRALAVCPCKNGGTCYFLWNGTDSVEKCNCLTELGWGGDLCDQPTVLATVSTAEPTAGAALKAAAVDDAAKVLAALRAWRDKYEARQAEAESAVPAAVRASLTGAATKWSKLTDLMDKACNGYYSFAIITSEHMGPRGGRRNTRRRGARPREGAHRCGPTRRSARASRGQGDKRSLQLPPLCQPPAPRQGTRRATK